MNDAIPHSTCTAHLVLHLGNLQTEQEYVEDQINLRAQITASDLKRMIRDLMQEPTPLSKRCVIVFILPTKRYFFLLN